ncbi:MAG: ParB/RepB/Spo0J family partition protein [Syntrophales bacterium]|jgi:ParB family chromosome partitioning protein|nr:ParB/RepB/Spo0J family partition protein [Syntrophales bacterium]MCK9390149.1 ParB/RepB/Spo0J family partition protein [Syntrophales bacterium]
MSSDENFISNQLYIIPLNDLLPDPDQPRKYFDPVALAELTESIRQQGILQPPLFRRGPDGLLYIVAGERRCSAARKAGLTVIPAIYKENVNSTELSLIENITRSDLNPIEEAEAFDRLKNDHIYQQDDLVRIFNKSKATISETLSLNRLPKEIRDECRTDPSVPKNVLVKIARKKQDQSMLKEYQRYREQMKPKIKIPDGATPSRIQKLFNTMDQVQTKISLVDIQAQSLEDRETFIIALEALKQGIETKIAEVAQ